MTPYVGCDYARERLEALIDRELSVDEQVAVESHVRWCRTCAARIEDMQLIGSSLREGPPRTSRPADIGNALGQVLVRVRAEREQAFMVRFRELFTDMRLLWPALGATFAVLLCVSLALGVLRSATLERPESLARRLAAMGNPGSEMNPLRPDNNARVDSYFEKYVDSDRAGGISMPRVLDDGVLFEGIGDEDAMFTMATVVSREGRIANAALLKSEWNGKTQLGDQADDVEALLDAVRQSRFAPAQTPVGRAVAVNMVWLIVVTKVQETPEPQPGSQVTRAATPPRRIAPDDEGEPLPLPLGRQSGRVTASPTA